MTPDQLRAMLLSNPAIGLPDDIGLAEPFALDSLALTWLVYHLQETYGVELDPEDARLAEPTSIETLAGYLDEHGAVGEVNSG